MQTKIHEPTQIVEVMLTHAEQADEAVKKQLKELYAQYKGTKYTVVVFLSGKRDLYEDTRDLLLFNRRRAAERAVQVPLPPLPNFLPLAMMNELMYNIIYKDIFGCRYIWQCRCYCRFDRKRCPSSMLAQAEAAAQSRGK